MAGVGLANARCSLTSVKLYSLPENFHDNCSEVQTIFTNFSNPVTWFCFVRSFVHSFIRFFLFFCFFNFKQQNEIAGAASSISPSKSVRARYNQRIDNSLFSVDLLSFNLFFPSFSNNNMIITFSSFHCNSNLAFQCDIYNKRANKQHIKSKSTKNIIERMYINIFMRYKFYRSNMLLKMIVELSYYTSVVSYLYFIETLRITLRGNLDSILER